MIPRYVGLIYLRLRVLFLVALVSSLSPIAVLAADSPPSPDADLAKVIFEGMAAYSANDYERALTIFRAGLSQAKSANNRLYVVALQSGIGEAEFRLNRLAPAHQSLTDALLVDRQLLAEGTVDKAIALKVEATILSDLALVEQQLNRPTEALHDLSDALAIAHSSLADPDLELLIRLNLRSVDRALGRFDDGLQNLSTALAIAQTPAHPQKVAVQGAILANIAADENHLGLNGEALRHLALARDIFNRAKDVLGEANVNLSLGVVQEELGQYDDSLRSETVALAAFRTLTDRRNEASALVDIANVYLSLGRYEDALHNYTDALAIFRNLSSDAPASANDFLKGILATTGFTALAPLEERPDWLEGTTLGNISMAYRGLGRMGDALKSAGSAVGIFHKLNDRDSEARALLLMGNLYDNTASALRTYDEAAAVFKELNDVANLSVALGNIAGAALALARYDDALASCRQSSVLSAKSGNAEQTWRSLFVCAASEAKLDRWKDAIDDYDRAIHEIEQLRSGLKDTGPRGTGPQGQTTRALFVEKTLFVYDAYITYLLELDKRFPAEHFDEKALDIFEREQGRAFFEEIGQSSARHFRDVPEAITAREAELAARIESTQEALAGIRAAPQPDADAVTQLEQQADALQRQQEALEHEIKASYLPYYNLLHPEPVQQQALESLLRPDEALLIYDVLSTQTALWVIDRSGVRLFRLPGDIPAKVADLLKGPMQVEAAIDNGAAETPLQRIDNIRQAVQSNLPRFAEESYALYNELVPLDARTVLEHAAHLFVVPTGVLYDLPWEALVTQPPGSDDYRYLIRDRTVSYLSSASLLSVLRVPRQSALYPIVAFANPTFGTAKAAAANCSSPAISPMPSATAPATSAAAASLAQLRMQTLANYVSQGGAHFADLPGTECQAQAIIAHLSAPGLSSPLYDGDAASLQNVLQLGGAACTSPTCLKNYRYVLFATHAVLPDQVQGLSQPALVLAHPDQGGFLTMGDAFGLSLNADIVALSACNTGRGIATHGDGVRGLTQAFMFAGTPVVSVTLWETVDSVSQRLMPSFFLGLAGGKVAPSEALRKAKLEFLSDPILKHPFFWAPTVLFGDSDGTSQR